ncbi:protein ENHANCED DISEASE RESISTANCE 2-like, partial [Bidens hawaiensis]|uniref:protein ENHANCED DISEASE RESISTANCE 2-like n=1 Tax=Bidens hawaiensis TaxID=980011 RepID=UPI0040496C69
MDALRQTDDEEIIMEGWLYLISSNAIGFKYSRKLYYVLQHHRFMCFRHSSNKDPIRTTVVDSSIRVTDNGKKLIRGKVLFVFTLSDTSNYDAHVKLGAGSPEEAAKWIKSFEESSKKVKRNNGIYLDCLRSTCSGRVFDKNDVDDIISLTSVMDSRNADMSEPSQWTIFGCHHGIRLFKQARYQEGHNKRKGHPALAAVSVVDKAPEVIFQTLMSLGFSRS